MFIWAHVTVKVKMGIGSDGGSIPPSYSGFPSKASFFILRPWIPPLDYLHPQSGRKFSGPGLEVVYVTSAHIYLARTQTQNMYARKV